MKFAIALAAAALVVGAPAIAQSMNAEEFYQRATRLKSKGALALFSGGELKTLTHEGHAAGEASAARLRADRSAGRRLRFCAPPGTHTMASDEFIKRLAAIPVEERRRIDMTEATTRILAGKFPCSP